MNESALEKVRAELRLLREAQPLPEGWTPEEEVLGEFHAAGVDVTLLGLTARGADGTELVASAAGIQRVAPRAYFELHERIAALEHDQRLKAGALVLKTLTLEGKEAGDLQLAPRGAEPAAWKESKSNGIAAGNSILEASRGAALELLERDRILRSWNGSGAPISMAFPRDQVPSGLAREYELSAWSFDANFPVVGLFGFPRDPARPLLMGFGSEADREAACLHALQEGIQRVAFLWDEAHLVELPEPRPSVDYHLDYYLCPKAWDEIRAWLAGKRVRAGGRERRHAERRADFSSVQVVDITPSGVRAGLAVARAISPSFFPLTFGLGGPWLADEFSGIPHPIA